MSEKFPVFFFFRSSAGKHQIQNSHVFFRKGVSSCTISAHLIDAAWSKPASICLGLELTGAKVAAHNHIWAFFSNLSFSVLEDRDFFGGSSKSAQLVKLFPIY